MTDDTMEQTTAAVIGQASTQYHPRIDYGIFGVVVTLIGTLLVISSRGMRKALLLPILMVLLIVFVVISNLLALKSTAVPLPQPPLDFITLDKCNSLETELKKAKIEVQQLKMQVAQLNSQLTSCNDRGLRSEHKDRKSVV